jgi:hypothetical protein
MNTFEKLTAGMTSTSRILLVVGAGVVMGLLVAAMVLETGALKANRLAKARTEMTGILMAIQQYESNYGRPPASQAVRNSTNAASPDFTFGTMDHGTNLLNGRTHQPLPAITNANGTGYQAANSEIMTILMDLDTGVNSNHVCNPQRIVFLSAKQADDVSSSGVGPDHVFRDPWGNPYIISLDLNFDGQTQDAFYRRAQVSHQTNNTTFNRLTNSTNPAGLTDNYTVKTNVMIWSLGPDGNADPTQPATTPPNLDNLLSW